MTSDKEALRVKVRGHRGTEAQMVLREYLRFLVEEQKERLITVGGEAADECRGFIKGVRNLLKDIETDRGEATKTNPYA